MNSKIKARDKEFDIGTPVIRYDQGGFDFTPKGRFQHYTKDPNQVCLHWTATPSAKSTFLGLNARGLSSNFIIDDNENDHGTADIYQCMDLVHGGWTQGRGLNDTCRGIEVAYRPQAWEDKSIYGDEHPIVTAEVHGRRLEVYQPSEPQMKAIFALVWGLCEIYRITPAFPKTGDKYVTSTIYDPVNYSGLVNHYNLKLGKIDAAGLDLKRIEYEVQSRLSWGY